MMERVRAHELSPAFSSELSEQILILPQGEQPCVDYEGNPAERSLADSKLLQAISAEMISERNVKGLYEKLIDAAVSIMRSDFASMQMLFPERGNGDELRLLAFRGFSPNAAEFWGRVRPDSLCACGEALRTGRRVIVPDVEKCNFLAGTESLLSYRETSIRSVQSTPLLSRDGRLLGMISTHWRKPHQPTERDLRLLDILARQAADLLERIRTAEMLHEIEERFRSVLNNAPAVIFIKDTEGRYIQVNQAFERLIHISQQELIGKTDFDLFPEEVARKFRENDLAVIRTGQPLEIEESLPHDDGLRTYISNKFPLRREDGSVYAVTGISTDITERKRNEAAAQRLAAIVASSDDAIVSKNLDGMIQSWNKGAERIFGYTAGEVIGKPVTILMPPERVNEEPGILERLRRGERIDHYETVRRRKDGTLLDISLTISPIKDASGKVVGASKIARDITDRKRMQREQQSLYDLVATMNQTTALPEICHAALDAVQRCLKVDRASVLLYEDDGVMRFKAWRGLSDDYRRAVEGHSPWERDDPNPRPVCIEDVHKAPIEAHLREVIEWEGIRALAFIPIRYEKRLVGKFMVYSNTPHRFTPEEIRPVETIATQIAFAIDRRRSGEALERLVQQRTASLREAIAQMEEFSYSVSHDLRAPVRAMQGYAKSVLEDYGARLDDAGRNYLDRIVRGGARMDRLIQDILTYSRLSRREIKLNPVALDRLVHEILSQYPEMQAAHADIVIRGKLAAVMGHEASLSQAISNLLNNAIKFVPPGTFPKVQLWTEQNDGHVRLWVEDNGIGIKPEYQHRLFGMFERIHPESKYEGTGIGLAIVRKAVERMGGKVGLESDGLTGSRFWIQLLAAVASEPLSLGTFNGQQATSN